MTPQEGSTIEAPSGAPEPGAAQPQAPSDDRPADNEPAAAAAVAEADGGAAPPEPPVEADATGSDEPDARDDGAAEETPAEAAEAGEAGEAGGQGDDTPGEAGAPGKKKRRRNKKRKRSGATDGGEPREARPHRPSDRVPFQTGEEVFGKVTAVLETAIMVDLSGKALAIFDRSEMEADDLVPEPGDRFVARVHNDGARGGLVVLTRKPLREEETKPRIEQALKDGELISGLVTGVIKGGVEVDVGGVRGFAPASGMDLHPAQANFPALVGERLEFKIASFDKRDLVITRRPMLEAEAHERRKRALALLEENQVLEGVVRTVVEWGAFVALPAAENLEGLVHVSEASHDSRRPMVEIFKPGDRFDVKIIKIDERGKIWLSRKDLIEDPWAEAKQKYGQGTRHTGKVTRLERFGAFVALDDDIEGLIALADLSLDRVEHPSAVLQDGQEVEVVVHAFDPRHKKIALHPAPTGDRAQEPSQKVARGALVKVEIVRGEGAGVIVRVLGVTGRAARGFIPAGQTGTARGTDLRKGFRPGGVLDVKVIDVDPRSGEPKLSIRGYKEDEERRAHKEYRQKLKAEASFGTLGDLLKAKLGAPPGRDA